MTDTKNSFKDIHDLATNGTFSEKVAYHTFIVLLDHFFKMHSGTIIINSDLETEENSKFILDNWETIAATFGIPYSVKKVKKLARQTINRIIEYFNNNSRFTLENKLGFLMQTKTIRINSTTTKNTSFTTLTI
jgi:hypothetical protein